MSLLIVPASAKAYIFWSSPNGNDSKIGRAGLDGSGVNNDLVTGIRTGVGVATDGAYVYWGESGNGVLSFAQIGRATIDGGEPNHEFQWGATYCGIFGVRVLGPDLYWLKNDCSPGGSRINKAAKIGGQGPGQYTEPGAGKYVCGFAVDANYVYWAEGHYIARAPNVSPPKVGEKTWLDIGVNYAACGIAVNSTHVYWTNRLPESEPGSFRGDSIGRASIDGNPTSVEKELIVGTSFYIGDANPSGIDVEGNFIYWTHQPAGTGLFGSIGRANLDGTGVDYSFIDNVYYPWGLDVDSAGPQPSPALTTPKTKRPPPPPMRIVVKGSSNSSFAPGAGSTAVRLSSGLASASKGVPRGTVFTYQLNQDAAITVEMNRVKAGRLVGKKCKRRTKANAKKKKCDLTEHKLFRKGKKGKNTLPYTGRVKGKALRPGAHVAVFTAKAPGGKPKSDSVGFRIVRP